MQLGIRMEGREGDTLFPWSSSKKRFLLLLRCFFHPDPQELPLSSGMLS
jgi:hypothetical protein